MKYLITIAACVLCVQHSFAQNYKKRTAEEKARYYTDEMVKELSLDSSISSKVFEINLLVSKQFDSLYATKPEKDDARQGAIAIYRKRDMALRTVLSTQQFLMFDDIQREKREKKKLEKEQKEKAEKGE
jgi:hypothetical protein